jgi:hypothetical protein
VNGIRQNSARFPNMDYANPLQTGHGYVTGVTPLYPPGSPSTARWPGLAPGGLVYEESTWTNNTWKGPLNGTIRIFPWGMNSWGSLTYQLTAINTTNSSLYFGQVLTSLFSLLSLLSTLSSLLSCLPLFSFAYTWDFCSFSFFSSTSTSTSSYCDLFWPNLPFRSQLSCQQGGWQHNTLMFWYAVTLGYNGQMTFFVEGISEELDFPGEWFLNSFIPSEPLLQLIPYPGVELSSSSTSVVAPYLRQLFEFTNGAKNIQLIGLNFTHTATTVLQLYQATSMGDLAIHRGGALFLQVRRR